MEVYLLLLPHFLLLCSFLLLNLHLLSCSSQFHTNLFSIACYLATNHVAGNWRILGCWQSSAGPLHPNQEQLNAWSDMEGSCIIDEWGAWLLFLFLPSVMSDVAMSWLVLDAITYVFFNFLVIFIWQCWGWTIDNAYWMIFIFYCLCWVVLYYGSAFSLFTTERTLNI